MSDKRYTEAQWLAIMDLRAHWHAFCDCDPFDGSSDFPDRMESAGFIALRKVTRDDLEQSFAADRGIEKGGMVWDMTAKGRRVFAAKGGDHE